MSREEFLLRIKNITNMYSMPYRAENMQSIHYACREYDKLAYEQQKEIERLNNIINELEKCIKEKYNEAHNYQTKIRQSDLQQGDYPVSYYYAERDEKMSIYYLDKLKELKESDNNE